LTTIGASKVPTPAVMRNERRGWIWMRAVVGVLVVALIGPGMRRIENHPRVWMATAGVILEHRYGPKAGSSARRAG